MLELISEFSKIAGSEVNTQKSVAFFFSFCTINNSKKEIKKRVSFVIASKIIEYCPGWCSPVD